MNSLVGNRKARAREKMWGGRETREFTLKPFGMREFDLLYKVPTVLQGVSDE